MGERTLSDLLFGRAAVRRRPYLCCSGYDAITFTLPCNVQTSITLPPSAEPVYEKIELEVDGLGRRLLFCCGVVAGALGPVHCSCLGKRFCPFLPTNFDLLQLPASLWGFSSLPTVSPPDMFRRWEELAREGLCVHNETQRPCWLIYCTQLLLECMPFSEARRKLSCHILFR